MPLVVDTAWGRPQDCRGRASGGRTEAEEAAEAAGSVRLNMGDVRIENRQAIWSGAWHEDAAFFGDRSMRNVLVVGVHSRSDIYRSAAMNYGVYVHYVLKDLSECPEDFAQGFLRREGYVK